MTKQILSINDKVKTTDGKTGFIIIFYGDKAIKDDSATLSTFPNGRGKILGQWNYDQLTKINKS